MIFYRAVGPAVFHWFHLTSEKLSFLYGMRSRYAAALLIEKVCDMARVEWSGVFVVTVTPFR